MARLRTAPTLPQPEADALYAEIVAAHRGLAPEEARRLDARLILLLANHVADAGAVREALALAYSAATRSDGADAGSSRSSMTPQYQSTKSRTPTSITPE